MRAALISSGIAAIVVLIGVIVEHWGDITDFIDDSNKKLRNQNELLEINRGILDKRLTVLGKERKYNEDNEISNEKLIEKEKKLLSLKVQGLKQLLKRKYKRNKLLLKLKHNLNKLKINLKYNT
mgnify:CR=1 FL=1